MLPTSDKTYNTNTAKLFEDTMRFATERVAAAERAAKMRTAHVCLGEGCCCVDTTTRPSQRCF